MTKFEVGDLVEVKYDEWYGRGASEVVHARLFVVDIEDATTDNPIYLLGESSKEQIQAVVRDIFKGADLTKWTILGSVIKMIRGRFHADRLTKIEMTTEVQNGVGALKLDDQPVKAGEYSVFRVHFQRQMACYDDRRKQQTTCWIDEHRVIVVEGHDAQPAIDLLRREVLEFVDPSCPADAPVNTVRGFRVTNVERICESKTILFTNIRS